MKLLTGGFLISVSDLEASVQFYCKVMELRVYATDGTSAMLGPADEDDPGQSWLLALRGTAGRRPLHPTGAAIGIRAVFFRVDPGDLDGLEERLRDAGGFHERHTGEFYEMVSACSPDRNVLGFWAADPGSGVTGPTFVPPSVYFLDD
jgi:catechol 2,3-dioxygenase-like lactoylglutathione lyase family enzyme